MKETLFCHKSDEWETPLDIFDQLNAEFHFDLDPCSTDQNMKCKAHYTQKENGLLQNWGGALRVLQSTIQSNISMGAKVL